MKPLRLFLACPVRGIDPSQSKSVALSLEAEGFSVHWPPRDTEQDDDSGYRICKQNLAAIQAADLVAVIWDGQSQGVLFDLGMAFALGKPLKIISLPDSIAGKSFQNMARVWANAHIAAPV